MSLVVQSRDVLLVTAGHHHQPPRSTGSAELQRRSRGGAGGIQLFSVGTRCIEKLDHST